MIELEKSPFEREVTIWEVTIAVQRWYHIPY